MLRLIKDNKIVGYEYRRFYYDFKRGMSKDVKLICVYQFTKFPDLSKDLRKYEPGVYIEHDYVELGVKVKDEWWFEGDMGVDKGGYGDSFVLEFDGVKFKLTFDDANLNMAVFCTNNMVDCKKTGNIHDIRHP